MKIEQKASDKQVFSIDGAFFSATSELPGISVQNTITVCQNGHNRYFLAKRCHLETMMLDFSWDTENTAEKYRVD